MFFFAQNTLILYRRSTLIVRFYRHWRLSTKKLSWSCVLLSNFSLAMCFWPINITVPLSIKRSSWKYGRCHSCDSKLQNDYIYPCFHVFSLEQKSHWHTIWVSGLSWHFMNVKRMFQKIPLLGFQHQKGIKEHFVVLKTLDVL